MDETEQLADGIMSATGPIPFATTKRGIQQAQDEEAKVAYSPLPTIITLGFSTGMVVASLPLIFVMINAIFALLSGVRGINLGAALQPLVMTPAFTIWVSFNGVLGVGSALARHWSARNCRYWWLNRNGLMRLGLDHVLAGTIGPFLLAIALLMIHAGPMMYVVLGVSPIPGVIIHYLWELLYCPLIRRFGRVSNADRIHALLISIKRHPALSVYDIKWSYNSQSRKLSVTIDSQDDLAVEWTKRAFHNTDFSQLGVEAININRTAS